MIMLMQMSKFQTLTFLFQLVVATTNRHIHTFHNTVMGRITTIQSTTDRIYEGGPIRL